MLTNISRIEDLLSDARPDITLPELKDDLNELARLRQNSRLAFCKRLAIAYFLLVGRRYGNGAAQDGGTRKFNEWCETNIKTATGKTYRSNTLNGYLAVGYPNVWLISTIVNQDEWDRDADKLLGTPAHIHGVSYEPALGPIKWGNVMPDWIIIGGESRQGSFEPRPFHLEWAQDTIDQCVSRGRAPFVKQLGSLWAEAHNATNPLKAFVSDRAGSNPEAWPAWARVREFPDR